MERQANRSRLDEARRRGPSEFERLSYTDHAAANAKRLRHEPTAGERRLWDELRKLKLNIRRQAAIGPYVVDFVSHASKLVVEVDGYHHRTDEGLESDAKRDAWLNAEGFSVARVSDRDAFERAAEVARKVGEIIEALPPRGGKGWVGGVRIELPTNARWTPPSVDADAFSDTRPDSEPSPPTPALPPSRGKGELWRVLCDVPDPEIPAVSVVDLGIVRQVSDEAVVITPTYTGCPATVAIEAMIRTALDQAGFADVAIKTVIDPPWTTDWISDEGREKLRAYGIAPPPKGAASRSLRGEELVECPRCASTDTEEVSRFGSTPCKALWRCRSCAEPFDRFKCH